MAGDRPNLNTQKGGDDLVLAVSNNCNTTVVVVHSVGPIIMEKWVQNPNVRAILWAHLPGMESGNALVDVLWGDVNPSGKLPYTIAKSLSDYGPGGQVLYVENGSPPQQDYNEGIFIDYRHFDKEEIEPRYEFGYGLSYTTFGYGKLETALKAPLSLFPARRPPPESKPPVYNSSIPNPSDALFPPGFTKINRMIYPYLSSSNITKKPYPYPTGYDTVQTPSQAGGGEGGNPALWEVLVTVSLTVKNTGKVPGAEVVQLYLEFPQNGPTGMKFHGAASVFICYLLTYISIEFPKNQLRGFRKVFLQAGASVSVTFDLTRRDLSYWDVVAQNWAIPRGGFGVNVGTSSRRLLSRGSVSCD